MIGGLKHLKVLSKLRLKENTFLWPSTPARLPKMFGRWDGDKGYNDELILKAFLTAKGEMKNKKMARSFGGPF
jgi:hypothetical protein